AAVLVQEDAARRVSAEDVVRDAVVARPVDRQALAPGSPEPDVDAREVEELPVWPVLAVAVVHDLAVLDDVVLRSRLEIDAGASRSFDVQVAQRHTGHVAVHEDADPARVEARA